MSDSKEKTAGLDLDYENSQEKMLELIIGDKDTTKNNWTEKGLPKLVDRILASYEEVGLIEHLEGKDLPSKELVIRMPQWSSYSPLPRILGEEDSNSVKHQTLHT